MHDKELFTTWSNGKDGDRNTTLRNHPRSSTKVRWTTSTNALQTQSRTRPPFEKSTLPKDDEPISVKLWNNFFSTFPWRTSMQDCGILPQSCTKLSSYSSTIMQALSDSILIISYYHKPETFHMFFLLHHVRAIPFSLHHCYTLLP